MQVYEICKSLHCFISILQSFLTFLVPSRKPGILTLVLLFFCYFFNVPQVGDGKIRTNSGFLTTVPNANLISYLFDVQEKQKCYLLAMLNE